MYFRKEIGPIYCSTCQIKQQYPWPTSSANNVVIYNWVNQGEMEPFKDHPSIYPSETSHSRRSMDKFQQQQCQPAWTNSSQPTATIWLWKVCLVYMGARFCQIQSKIHLKLSKCTTDIMVVSKMLYHQNLQSHLYYDMLLQYYCRGNYIQLLYWGILRIIQWFKIKEVIEDIDERL